MFAAARADTDKERMRISVLTAGLVVLKASAAGSPDVELRGAAHAGDRHLNMSPHFPVSNVHRPAPDFALTYSLRRDVGVHRP